MTSCRDARARIRGDGADLLDGGAWKDVLTGGNGADSFYFANIAQAGDSITDFHTSADHIALSGAGFGIDHKDGISFVEWPQLPPPMPLSYSIRRRASSCGILTARGRKTQFRWLTFPLT